MEAATGPDTGIPVLLRVKDAPPLRALIMGIGAQQALAAEFQGVANILDCRCFSLRFHPCPFPARAARRDR